MEALTVDSTGCQYCIKALRFSPDPAAIHSHRVVEVHPTPPQGCTACFGESTAAATYSLRTGKASRWSQPGRRLATSSSHSFRSDSLNPGGGGGRVLVTSRSNASESPNPFKLVEAGD